MDNQPYVKYVVNTFNRRTTSTFFFNKGEEKEALAKFYGAGDHGSCIGVCLMISPFMPPIRQRAVQQPNEAKLKEIENDGK